jgi:signal transduction histidine kinase
MIGRAETVNDDGRERGGIAGSGSSVDLEAGHGEHVLLVEDDEGIRDSLGPLLEEEGYRVSFARNGREALEALAAGAEPALIVLDLRMPVMDGWEFRTIQRKDPRLGAIPVLAISADSSPKAAAISADAYLGKPFGAREILSTIARLLGETRARIDAREAELERRAMLGNLAAGVGHEINNPLAIVVLNLGHSLEKLGEAICSLDFPAGAWPSSVGDEVKESLVDVSEMLTDCQTGADRIREIVAKLQTLSRHREEQRAPVDVHQLIDVALSAAREQIRARARIVTNLAEVPPALGNASALGRVVLALLLNAAESIPEGAAEQNEIAIRTSVASGLGRENELDPIRPAREVVIEIRDSGGGMTPATAARLFDPFFTTKPLGQGAGLGLSMSQAAVNNHGGRIAVESAVGRGTVFRVFLPIDGEAAPDDPRSARAERL